MVALADISALILCEQRQDRRVLFDALDSLDLGELYTARNIAQAEQFLSEIRISLLVIELGFSSEEINRLLEVFFASPEGRLLAVLPPAEQRSGWSWEFLPPRVTECLQSPVETGEVLFRLNRMFSDPVMAAAEGDDDSEEDLLFDAVDEEYVLSDPKSGQILEVNQPFLQRAGGDAAAWTGQGIDLIGLVEQADERRKRWERLRNEGQVRFRCELKADAGPPAPVEISRRLGMRSGRLVYLTRIRDIQREVRLARLLNLLATLFPNRIRGEVSGRLADIVSDCLDLDYFTAATVTRSGEVRVVAAHSRGKLAELLADQQGHLPYRKLLQGEEICIAREAAAVVGRDPFIQSARVHGYVGLPVLSTGNAVIGVVIAARRQPIDHLGETVAALRIISGQLGLQWEARALRAQSETQGLHDVLTGLPNRMLFNDRLALALKEAQRSGEMVALMFVDLDRFKTINDSLGHAVGDQVLMGVAERLKLNIRSSDTVARLAGDEFTVILRHIVHKDDVARVAEKINRVLADPLPIDGQDELQITASIGVSFFPDDGRTAEQLLKHADMAMYSAKGLGRNTHQNYVDQPEESQQQKLILESKLRHAEANGELRVFYQPQVATESEDIVGMEALIRWDHPELGLISPGFFIPLAEETGLIVPIGEWLLRKATRETRAWQERFGLPLILGVNLSPLQLKQPQLLQIVENALNEAELEPRFLDLEVTESISIKSIPGLSKRLEALRDLGCRISIDDFGTGQASLDYLKRFPADRIKIDQSFVRNIGVDPDDEAIVRATISMAHSLKMGVIAEGVEQEDHLDFLRTHGCEELQGYLFCRPLPGDAFSRMLLEREQLTVGPRADTSPEPAPIDDKA